MMMVMPAVAVIVAIAMVVEMLGRMRWRRLALLRSFVQALSPAEAATLPLAYLTAWYALVEVAQLQPGERVLTRANQQIEQTEQVPAQLGTKFNAADTVKVTVGGSVYGYDNDKASAALRSLGNTTPSERSRTCSRRRCFSLRRRVQRESGEIVVVMLTPRGSLSWSYVRRVGWGHQSSAAVNHYAERNVH